MASSYPGSLDNFPTIDADKKLSDSIGGRTHRAMHNDLGDAVEAVQAELGTNPSAAFATVAARLAAAEDRIAALEGTTPVTTPLPYGPGIGTDTIANLITGVDQTAVSQMFRADTTGTPTWHRWVLKMGGAYSGTTTGEHRVSIQTDNGAGLPSGTILDQYTVHTGQTTGHYNWAFDGQNATLTAGNIYHLVIENMEGTNSSTRYFSVNNILIFAPQAGRPRQPRYADADLGVLVRKPGGWEIASQYTPTFDLTYYGGHHQGQGYVDMQSASGSVISGNSMVRERFTVSGAQRTVTTAWVRLMRTSGTGALTVRLEDSGGSLIDSGTIAAASVQLEEDTSDPGNGLPDHMGSDGQAGRWVSATFTTPQTLQSGQTYNLRLSCAAGTTYWMRLIKEGYANGYTAGHFDDGYAEESTNGGTSWGAPSGITAGQGDLQFYLT